MVERFRLTNAKHVTTPMDHSIHFSMEQSPTTLNQSSWMHGIPYNEAIGSVLWPVVMSRPDAMYAVGVLLQFIQNPGLNLPFISSPSYNSLILPLSEFLGRF